MTIPEFIAKWRKVELKERSAAQEHFLDLCRVFDHPTSIPPTRPSACRDSARTVDAGAVHRLVDGMTPKTWRRLRDELLSPITKGLEDGPTRLSAILVTAA